MKKIDSQILTISLIAVLLLTVALFTSCDLFTVDEYINSPGTGYGNNSVSYTDAYTALKEDFSYTTIRFHSVIVAATLPPMGYGSTSPADSGIVTSPGVNGGSAEINWTHGTLYNPPQTITFSHVMSWDNYQGEAGTTINGTLSHSSSNRTVTGGITFSYQGESGSISYNASSTGNGGSVYQGTYSVIFAGETQIYSCNNLLIENP